MRGSIKLFILSMRDLHQENRSQIAKSEKIDGPIVDGMSEPIYLTPKIDAWI